MTWYLTVRPDRRYSRCTATEAVIEHLRPLPGLVQTGPQEFRNAPGSPWVDIVLARADGGGSYVVDRAPEPAVNVVELICGDGNDRWYESLAEGIASFLGWEVVEEDTGRTIHAVG